MLRVPRSWSELDSGWMTSALGARFPGAIVGELEIGPIVDGTNSRATVSLRYSAGAGPERVFVKREGAIVQRVALVALGALANEARLFASGASLPLERPAAYAGACDRRRLAAIVVMEDVTIRGGRPNVGTSALSVGQVRNGLRALAGMHAAYWGPRLPPALSFLRPWHMAAFWAPISLASLLRAIHLLRSGGHGALLPAHGNAVRLERDFRAWSLIAANATQTVLHGDPHPANTYAISDTTIGFYDWQLVRTGTWAHDVGYFMVSCLDIDDRRTNERTLLLGYLEDLRSAGAPAPGFEEAWELYRRSPTYGLGAWLHTVAGARFHPLPDCLEVIARFGAAYGDHCAD